MNNSHHLFRAARSLVPSRFDVKRHAKSLERNLHRIHTVVKHARGSQDPIQQAHLHLLIDRLYSASDAIGRSYLQSPKKRLFTLLRGIEDITNVSKPLPRVLISQEHSTNTGFPTQSFHYIPFSFVQGDTYELRLAVQEFSAKKVPSALEKTYRLDTPKVVAHTKDIPWNLGLVHAQEAWQYSEGENIRIAIIDTGCDYRHKEIRDRFEQNKGYNFVTNTNDPSDNNGHGTHVAGSASGETVGVAPKSTLYALKFLDQNGHGYEVDFIRAAEWAITEQVHVVNGSFGSSRYSRAEKAICDAMYERGIVFVAAAGNNGTMEYGYPASYDSVISVAAIDQNKAHAWFSQRNDKLDCCAPGVQVRSCVPGGSYDKHSGTSMAAPHVAGAYSLVLSANKSADTLLDYSETIGPLIQYGRGIVRPDLALEQSGRKHEDVSILGTV